MNAAFFFRIFWGSDSYPFGLNQRAYMLSEERAALPACRQARLCCHANEQHDQSPSNMLLLQWICKRMLFIVPQTNRIADEYLSTSALKALPLPPPLASNRDIAANRRAADYILDDVRSQCDGDTRARAACRKETFSFFFPGMKPPLWKQMQKNPPHLWQGSV